MTTPLDLEAIEAAARAPMTFDRPKIHCTHDEERGHAPWCFACDVADRAIEANEILPSTNSEHIATLRASIPTPDPAAFVAAVDAYGQWCGTIGSSLATGGTARFLADCERERDAARAALLKLGGVR